ncbi:SubName: Full=Uncharacterized protein {ECO:0000313/EMBL:CCA75294.1} [Serendipita indica DSM 11827]|uniref:Integrase catalytic domain-containing protein n=1 Tax=Serendipita indica (strain DSM 11827) TaxID=1109443 RepID=G4TVF1_SERID|nr:SubName: Full=Uncharacterized protein {ECO:0000313/EMBL:CCA75294.1} [Serendipita indica DSM 11827]CCA75294.1 hypothetical protein PIIN_09278 [Serendipita indica DSM 11827]
MLLSSTYTGNTKESLIQHFNDMVNANARLKQHNMSVPDSIVAISMVNSIGHKEPAWKVLQLQAWVLEKEASKLTSAAVRDFYVNRVPFSLTKGNSVVTSSTNALLATTPASTKPKGTATSGKGWKKPEFPTCEFCRHAHGPDDCWKNSHEELKALKARGALTQTNVAQVALSPARTVFFANETTFVGNDIQHVPFCRLIDAKLAANIIHASAASPTFKDAINVDSSCNVHMLPVRSYFDDEGFEMLVTPVPIKIGDDSFAYASHRGNISLLVPRKGLPSTMPQLRRVLYCSTLATTLISPQLLNDNGLITVLNRADSAIYYKKGNLLVAHCPQSPTTNLYTLVGTTKSSFSHASLLAATRTLDINLLHRIMGHLNYDDMRRVVAKRMTEKQYLRKVLAMESTAGNTPLWNLRSISKMRGIEHQTTTPYAPQQNGKAERKNCTLLTTAIAMLEESRLSSDFWADAFVHANDIINCRPHSKQKRTPFEAWHGSKPLIAHYKPFGCPAFVLDHHSATKVAPRSKYCQFLGMSETSKGYRLWCPEEKRVLVSREVHFDLVASNPIPAVLLPLANISDVHAIVDATLSEKAAPVSVPTADTISTQQQVTLTTEKYEDETIAQQPEAHAPSNSEHVPALEAPSHPPSPIPEPVRLPSPPRRRCRNKVEMLYESFQLHPDNIGALATTLTSLEEWMTELQGEYLKDWTDKEVDYWGIGICLSALSGPEEPPKTIQQVLSLPEKEWNQWLQAIYGELDSLIEKGVIEPVAGPPSWQTSSQQLASHEGHVPSRERSKTQGIDYQETFAPVVKATSVRLLFALSAQLSLKVDHLDVETAFLHGELEEEIYILPPAGWDKLETKNLGSLWRLLKSLYGLKQASLVWNTLLDRILRQFGFIRLQSDFCLYVYRRENEVAILAVYVDDMALAYSCQSMANEIKEFLSGHISPSRILAQSHNSSTSKSFMTLNAPHTHSHKIITFNNSSHNFKFHLVALQLPLQGELSSQSWTVPPPLLIHIVILIVNYRFSHVSFHVYPS